MKRTTTLECMMELVVKMYSESGWKEVLEASLENECRKGVFVTGLVGKGCFSLSGWRNPFIQIEGGLWNHGLW